jgi:CDP-glycerol glycerophosphotransferase
VFLYFEDIKDYLEERGVYFDVFSLPFPAAQSVDDLIMNIRNFDGAAYLRKVEAAFQKLDSPNDGKASGRVVNRIVEEISR